LISVSVRDVDQQVVVLGRAQQAEVAGLPWTRRMSGGGAVLLTPGEVVWIDVEVSRDDRRWDDDVGRATWWVGEAWLAALDLPGAEVHRGGVVRCTPWCKAVCFGGLGPGEVHIDQRKVVGIAQRRTREYALFQCAVHRRWDPESLVRALGLPDRAVGELRDAVVEVPDADGAALAAVLERFDPTL
jgi:lipoate-protein ligase A